LKGISDKRVESQPSIAVLPFANLSRDAEDEYFSDGLSEEIINTLAQAGLKVIARTSAFAFKGKNEDIRKIAEALGVTKVLEGSVRRAGGRLRVKAQLIHASDGTHVWSQRFDRELTDVFAVQDEIAAAIAEALRGKVAGKPAGPRQHEANLPAYEAYLKGRHLQSRTDVPENQLRIEMYLKQAMALDPDWADPHSALAEHYLLLASLGLGRPDDMMACARAEARKALELHPSDSNAHAVLGAVAALRDYPWEEAGERFRLATACESAPPSVHEMCGLYYLIPLRRFDEAIEQQRKAIALDPLNALARARLLTALCFGGRYPETLAEAGKALELDQNNHLAHLMIAHALLGQGKSADARRAAEEAYRHGPWHSGTIGTLAGLLKQAGETERALQLIATMRTMVPPGMLIYHLVCGEIDLASDWCERAIEQHEPFLTPLISARIFKPLRSSPRWPRLARMMALPETT